ncbi:hypothetical protein BJ912DRAFT_934464 [Pholiota molesta]|nr:hypothetical protein BJ912DRAFT_934464 [Pholiota molesta]
MTTQSHAGAPLRQPLSAVPHGPPVFRSGFCVAVLTLWARNSRVFVKWICKPIYDVELENDVTELTASMCGIAQKRSWIRGYVLCSVRFSSIISGRIGASAPTFFCFSPLPSLHPALSSASLPDSSTVQAQFAPVYDMTWTLAAPGSGMECTLMYGIAPMITALSTAADYIARLPPLCAHADVLRRSVGRVLDEPMRAVDILRRVAGAGEIGAVMGSSRCDGYLGSPAAEYDDAYWHVAATTPTHRFRIRVALASHTRSYQAQAPRDADARTRQRLDGAVKRGPVHQCRSSPVACAVFLHVGACGAGGDARGALGEREMGWEWVRVRDALGAVASTWVV